MPVVSNKVQAMRESGRLGVEARLGKMFDDRGFVIITSKTDMSNLVGLKICAKEFGKCCNPDTNKNFPKKPGDGLIKFNDELSVKLEEAGDEDYRPYRGVLCKLVVKQAEGEEGKKEIVDTFPATAAYKGQKMKKKHLKMVNKIRKKAYKELVDILGSGIDKEMMVTKITLIAYGSRHQMVHRDMTLPPEENPTKTHQPPGSMIFNLQGGPCGIGIVYEGDSDDEDEPGKSFRHHGGVAYNVTNIPKGSFAWLDGYTAHFGAVHKDPCVCLHVEFKRNKGLEEVLEKMKNDSVEVVTAQKLLDKHKQSTTPALNELQKDVYGLNNKRKREDEEEE